MLVAMSRRRIALAPSGRVSLRTDSSRLSKLRAAAVSAFRLSVRRPSVFQHGDPTSSAHDRLISDTRQPSGAKWRFAKARPEPDFR